MTFTSIQFIIFLIVTFIIFYNVNGKYRWLCLLIGSFVFYMSWSVVYVLPILLTTLSSYYAGIAIAKTDNDRRKILFLTSNVIFNVVLLLTFKYFNFFVSSFSGLLSFSSSSSGDYVADILVPLGISFYTLQAVAYPIDVYQRRIKPEKHFGIYALYIIFFQKLLAGPVERAGNLIPQLHKAGRFDYNHIRSGLRRMLWGFFKKVVIADRLAFAADRVYAAPESFGSVSLLIAVFFFLCKSILISPATPI